ncbi:MAG: hypothetical protein GKS07_08490 [Nitrosopumilus sp.]|nr:MAG: hypothetical protein GKS07_08490 [Nitrosopumilus sp.]
MKGMNDLLDALGYSQNNFNVIKLIFIFWVVTAGFSLVLSIGQITGFFEELWIMITHTVSWGVWIFWQSIVFPHRFHKNKELDRTVAYGKSFYFDILPGVAFGISLMLRPFSYGLFSEMDVPLSPILLVLSIAMMTCSLVVLFYSFRALGISGASFLTEFSKTKSSWITIGIYSHIRHPIFLAGMIGSLGISLLFFNDYMLLLILINIGVLPIYAKSEDLRLSNIFGKEFEKYSSQTGAFLPKFNLIFRKND